MSGFKAKWFSNDALNGDKVRLDNGQYLRARNNADTADVNMMSVDSNDRLQLGAEPIYSGTPSTSNSLVNKSYLLDVVAGLRDMKDAARVCADSNIALTGGASLNIDGIDLADNDRVVLVGQTDASENGIYVVSGIGTAYSLARSSDANSNEEVTQGLSVDIVEGLVYGKTRWLLTTDNITLDTTNLTFVQTPMPETPVQFKEEKFTIDSTILTNGYVDLANQIENASLVVFPVGGPVQESTVDYTLSVVSDKTRVTFAGDLATLLEVGDKLVCKYAHF